MKNKISLALKDPILQQGFEIICKENAGLKSKCRTCVYIDSPCVPSDYPSKDGVCNHYKNVFEENAELKDYAIQLKTETAKRDTELTKQLLELDKERIKAKELLRDFLSVAIDYIDKEDKNYSFIVEAEQFLQETDIDNAIQQANESLDFDKIADEMKQDLKESEVEK